MTPLRPPGRAVLVTAVLVTACAPSSAPTPDSDGREPVWPGAEWPVSSPGAEGLVLPAIRD